MCYIGQTGRNFLTRMKEHRRCWRNGDETSLLAKHILKTSHCCRFQPEVLHLDNKGIRLDVLEQFEITQSDINILMNEQIFVTQSPLLKIPFPKTNGQTVFTHFLTDPNLRRGYPVNPPSLRIALTISLVCNPFPAPLLILTPSQLP